MRRIITSIVFACVLLLAAAGCRHAKVTNPIANIDSKQPDKTLFDRAMKEMKGAKFVVARTLLETLINTYPDSEYVARAKLSIGDSWMAEGGTAAMQQAEAEYKDFITFFPNLPEAAEAQLKIADIHYKQMEKRPRLCPRGARGRRVQDPDPNLSQQLAAAAGQAEAARSAGSPGPAPIRRRALLLPARQHGRRPGTFQIAGGFLSPVQRR